MFTLVIGIFSDRLRGVILCNVRSLPDRSLNQGRAPFTTYAPYQSENYSSVECKFQPIRLYVYQRTRFAALTDRDLLHFSPSLRMPVGENYPKSTRTVEEAISAPNI